MNSKFQKPSDYPYQGTHFELQALEIEIAVTNTEIRDLEARKKSLTEHWQHVLNLYTQKHLPPHLRDQ